MPVLTTELENLLLGILIITPKDGFVSNLTAATVHIFASIFPTKVSTNSFVILKKVQQTMLRVKVKKII